MVSSIQSIVFNKKYWDLNTSKSYLKLHKFVPIKKVDITNNTFRYRLENPKNFNHFITKKTANGINFIIGFR